jgi:prolyl-tRNA editing enzyme YbaK/EbsC (Cys-tRNA(Pro) deacylase)/predicted Fe-S protein YdhL (DUF1289 family)
MNLPESVRRVADALAQRGHAHAPRMLDASARTAQEAADALGVQLGQIAKSIVFRREPDQVAVMVVTSGDQRVDERKLAARVCPGGHKLARADAEFVKQRTGFAIGGVAPLAHVQPPVLLLDLSLFRFEQIWAAAGHPHAVFPASPAQLALLTQARLDDVSAQGMDLQARAMALLRAQAAMVACDPQAEPPSPCLSVCCMAPDNGLCVGCLRTIDEIAHWSSLSVPQRHRVWQAIAQRAAPQPGD